MSGDSRESSAVSDDVPGADTYAVCRALAKPCDGARPAYGEFRELKMNDLCDYPQYPSTRSSELVAGKRRIGLAERTQPETDLKRAKKSEDKESDGRWRGASAGDSSSLAPDDYRPSQSLSPNSEASGQGERKALIELVRRSTKGKHLTNSCGNFTGEQYIRILKFLKQDQLDHATEEPHEMTEVIAVMQRRVDSGGSGSVNASDVKSLLWVLELPLLDPCQKVDMNQAFLREELPSICSGKRDIYPSFLRRLERVLVNEKSFKHPDQIKKTIKELLSKVRSDPVNLSKEDDRILRSLIRQFSTQVGLLGDPYKLAIRKKSPIPDQATPRASNSDRVAPASRRIRTARQSGPTSTPGATPLVQVRVTQRSPEARHPPAYESMARPLLRQSAPLSSTVSQPRQSQTQAAQPNARLRRIRTSSSLFSPQNQSSHASASAGLQPGVTSPLSYNDMGRVLDVYLAMEFVALPVLDVTTLKAYHEAFSNGDDTLMGPQAAILKLCLALACLVMRNSGFTAAVSFYEEAMHLLGTHEDSNNDVISLIQCWILQAQYLYATGQLRSSREAIFRARMRAESLNLHRKAFRDTESLSVPEQNSLQLGRAIWLGIQTIECALCLHLGTVCMSFTTEPPTSIALKASQFPGDSLEEEDLKALILGFSTSCGDLYHAMSSIPILEKACGALEGRCPLEQLQTEDNPFDHVRQMEHALYSWERRIPKALQWNESIETTDEEPSLMHRARKVLRLRHLYMRLRMYRPFLTLGLSLSQNCVCGPHGPHINGGEIFSLTAPSYLGTFRECAIKCVVAAEKLHGLLRDWIEVLSPGGAFEGASSAVENLQYLYACGLVFIAARMTPFVINAMGPKNVCVPELERAFNEICILMGKYDLPGQSAKENPVKRQFSVCQSVLRKLSKAAGDVDELGTLSEGKVLAPGTWERIYARLDIPLPSQRTEDLPNSSSSDPPMLLGWIGSLPVDLEDEEV